MTLLLRKIIRIINNKNNISEGIILIYNMIEIFNPMNEDYMNECVLVWCIVVSAILKVVFKVDDVLMEALNQ